MTKKPGGMQARLSQSFSRIPSEDTPRIYRIRLDEIELNPDQPRKHFDEEGLRELARSIERHGLIQPITVKRADGGGKYLLVAGERRFRAHQLLGREDILAVVTAGNPDEISLIENVQRQDLHPLEEAAAYARMMERYGWTQEEVADVVGKARPTVTNILKLNELPEAIRAECSTSNVASKSLLLEIARVPDREEQLRLWQEVRTGRGTVRGTRARKEGGEVRDNLSPLAKALAAGRSLVRRLERLPTEDLVTNRDQYHELLALKQRFDDLLAEHTARGGELQQQATQRMTHSPAADA